MKARRLNKSRKTGGYKSSAEKQRCKAQRNRRMARKLLAKLIEDKKLADSKKDAVASCATRTVEWPSSHQVGKEENKLLFALALGLIPKFAPPKKVQPSLTIRLEKLDPAMVANMQAVTQNRDNLFSRKQTPETKEQQRRADSPTPVYFDPVTRRLVPLKLIPETEEPRISPKNVEVVDLCSDDDDEEPMNCKTVALNPSDNEMESVFDAPHNNTEYLPTPPSSDDGVNLFEGLTKDNANMIEKSHFQYYNVCPLTPPDATVGLNESPCLKIKIRRKTNLCLSKGWCASK